MWARGGASSWPVVGRALVDNGERATTSPRPQCGALEGRFLLCFFFRFRFRYADHVWRPYYTKQNCLPDTRMSCRNTRRPITRRRFSILFIFVFFFFSTYVLKDVRATSERTGRAERSAFPSSPRRKYTIMFRHPTGSRKAADDRKPFGTDRRRGISRKNYRKSYTNGISLPVRAGEYRPLLNGVLTFVLDSERSDVSIFFLLLPTFVYREKSPNHIRRVRYRIHAGGVYSEEHNSSSWRTHCVDSFSPL